MILLFFRNKGELFINNRKNYNCIVCGKPIRKSKTGKCIDCYNEEKSEATLKKWLETGDTGCSVVTTIRGPIRRYLYKEQDYCCEICGMSNKWNNKELKFVLDHIDGNANNNFRSNLRLICPNCDSQLDTFKSKNKNSARKYKR